MKSVFILTLCCFTLNCNETSFYGFKFDKSISSYSNQQFFFFWESFQKNPEALFLVAPLDVEFYPQINDCHDLNYIVGVPMPDSISQDYVRNTKPIMIMGYKDCGNNLESIKVMNCLNSAFRSKYGVPADNISGSHSQVYKWSSNEFELALTREIESYDITVMCLIN